MSTSQPDLSVLLQEWWGGGDFAAYTANVYASAAANIIFGSNPPYQLSDFLAMYPKFGKDSQSLVTVVPHAATPGLGYVVKDAIAVIQPGGVNGVLIVTAIGAGGAITGVYVQSAGSGYSVASGVLTLGSSGNGWAGLGGWGNTWGWNITNGAGALVDILAVSDYTGIIPAAVLQMYINLASACLAQARWQEMWPLAMALYVAHYATLYLISEGGIGSTPQQIAVSGLAAGLAVSKSAGDVSQSSQYFTQGWESWGSWNLTIYGQQLITMAKIVGIGNMYIW